MILSCPQCETRFLLPATTLGEGGRRVKCSNCAKIWHQDPDLEELAENQEEEEQAPPEDSQEQEEPDSDEEAASEADQESDVDDIPEGVKPIPEGSSVPAVQEDEGTARRKMIGGVGAAAFIFILIFTGLYLAHRPIASNWPASAAFYDMLGMHMDVPGEGLVFDRLVAKVDDDGSMEKISIQGHIVNLTSQDQRIPLIEASLKDSHDEVLIKWIVPVTEEGLKAEGDISFSTENSFKKNQAQNVHLRFVLRAGDGTEVPVEEKSEHAPAHIESKDTKSHAPAASHH